MKSYAHPVTLTGILSLETTENTSEGYNTTIFNKTINYIGKTGVAVSDLRPAGKITIDGDQIDGQSDGEYIHKGDRIIVKEMKNNYLIVRKIGF